MKEISIEIIPQLTDNYSYILKSNSSSSIIIIDPAESVSHIEYIKKNNLSLDSIFLTHHHYDHVGGVKEILKEFPHVKVFSPNFSIDGTTHILSDNLKITTKLNEFISISTPGHTLEHMILYDQRNSILFSGDTLFRLGCGRIFEGTFEQMFNSLKKINNFPDSTKIYCGHEYTMKNLSFLESQFDNFKIFELERNKIEKQFSINNCTIPFSLNEEKKINPFLNPSSSYFDNFKKKYNFSNFEMFKFLREKKDVF